MKTIAKVLESMLTKDATQSWGGQPTMPAPEQTWWWGGGIAEETDIIL